jgi:prophage regulatory protein
MRITFESDDLQAIAEAVARKLAPLITKVQEAAARPIASTLKRVSIRKPEVVRVIKTAGEVIRRKELCQITGLSMATLWRQEHEGYFPAHIRLTNHSVGWRRSKVEAWLASRPTV